MDLSHHTATGQVTSVEVTDSGRRVKVDFASDGKTHTDYTTYKFAFSQLLKFADLRKGDLKNDDNEILPEADSMIEEALEGSHLVFKYNTDKEILGVVSPDYVSIPTEEVCDTVRQTIASMGISDFEMKTREYTPNLVEEVDFIFGEEKSKQVANVGDTLRGGLHIRNSVFGASSLRINQFYTILACDNGMTVSRTQQKVRQVHMGDGEELRGWLVDRVEEQVESIWENTDLIQEIASIEFPIEDQIDFLDRLAGDRQITKSAASVIAGSIIDESGEDFDDYEAEEFEINRETPDENFNTGREDVWGLLNAFTGYATHSELSSNSTIRQIERTYNSLLEVEDHEDLEAMVE